MQHGTPLMRAIKFSSVESLHCLIDGKADVNKLAWTLDAKHNMSPLMCVALRECRDDSRRCNDIIAALVEAKAQIDMLNDVSAVVF